MHLTGRRFRRTMAENRSAYIVTEKGTYTENNQHFASYRPVIMSMLSDELQLSELSNTQFYKKISRVITGQYNSSQNRGGANNRYFRSVVGQRRDLSNLSWSAPQSEIMCERPFLNMGPLCSQSPQVLSYRIDRTAVSAPSATALLPELWGAPRRAGHSLI